MTADYLHKPVAAMRRYLWLYSMGAIALGPLKALLVVWVIHAMRTAKVRAAVEVQTDYEVPVDIRLPDRELEENSARHLVDQALVDRLPSPAPELLTDEELALMGDGLLDAAQSLSDDEVLGDDWLDALDAEYAEAIERDRLEHEAWLSRYDAEVEEEERRDREAELAERDREREEDERLEREEQTEAERLERLEDERERLEREREDAEDRRLEDAEADELDLDDDDVDYDPDARRESLPPLTDDDRDRIKKDVARMMGEIARTTQARAANQRIAGFVDGLAQAVENGTQVLPDRETVVVWAADDDPCPECVALEGTRVRGRRGHHVNCQCVPDLQPKVGSDKVPGFLGLTLEQLRHQLTVMEPLKPSAWKIRQTKRLQARITELESDHE